MKIVVVVGAKRQGKTTFLKNQISKFNKCLIYDVYNDYDFLPVVRKPEHISKLDKCRILPFDFDFKELTNIVTGKYPVTNRMIVIEEATNFLEGAVKNEGINRILSGTAHYNNYVFFVFHYITRIPPKITDAMDFIVVFNTKESEKSVKDRFRDRPDIYIAWKTKRNKFVWSEEKQYPDKRNYTLIKF